MNHQEDYVPHAQILLDRASENKYYVTENSIVSASILKRYEDGTPLNDTEQEFFNTISTDNGQKLLDKVWEMTEKVIDHGTKRYSMVVIFSVIRWETDFLDDIDLDDGTNNGFALNDHGVPYCSRWINESLETPLYTVRGVKNENLASKPSDWTMKVF